MRVLLLYEIRVKLPDFKKPAYNTDNKGKLFVTVFAFAPAPAPKTNS